jgi:hypothetical protein
MNNDLMNKLVVAKKIMDKHNETPRGGVGSTQSFNTPQVQNFNPIPASYNIPQEYVQEQQVQQPVNQNLPVKDRILNSKLPDEIKKLMIEHPIDQPNNMTGPTLSNDLIEAASRLMNTNSVGELPNPPRQQSVPQPQNNSGIDYSLLKSILRDTINEVLTEKGLIPESTTKTKELISFRVGQHIFEGVVTKIKKLK